MREPFPTLSDGETEILRVEGGGQGVLRLTVSMTPEDVIAFTKRQGKPYTARVVEGLLQD